MALISYSKETVNDYVLLCYGNRTTEDPCVVGIKQLSFGDTREFERTVTARQEGAENQAEALKVRQDAQKEQFVKHVTYIKNWYIDGTPVDDVERFYIEAPPAAVAEVVQAIQNSAMLSEGQAKNFKRASGGTSQAKSPAARSTATSVKGGSKKNATAATD